MAYFSASLSSVCCVRIVKGVKTFCLYMRVTHATGFYNRASCQGRKLLIKLPIAWPRLFSIARANLTPGSRSWKANCGLAREEAQRDDNVRAIVLTSVGRGFCAGADMSLVSGIADRGLDGQGRDQVLHSGISRRKGVPSDFQKRYSYFPAIGKPVTAAINGPLVGMDLFCGGWYRYAVPTF